MDYILLVETRVQRIITRAKLLHAKGLQFCEKPAQVCHGH